MATGAAASDVEPLDSAHSHWELWGTWRRGPDLVAQVARQVRRASDENEFELCVHIRGDVERFSDPDTFTERVTGQALKHFDAILIRGAKDGICTRVSFVRRPWDVSVGVRCERSHRIRRGVVLEVTSAVESSRARVGEVKRSVAAAIERGRPRWVTRRSVSGHARRAQAPDGVPPERGATASRVLEKQLHSWPKSSGFPALFVAGTLLLAAAFVYAVEKEWLGKEEVAKDLAGILDFGEAGHVVFVAVLGLILAGFAYWLQAWLFPAVEVATQTNLRRATRLAASSVPLSALAGLLASVGPEIPGWFADRF